MKQPSDDENVSEGRKECLERLKDMVSTIVYLFIIIAPLYICIVVWSLCMYPVSLMSNATHTVYSYL